MPEIEVWLELLGRRAVPAHENPAQQWGQPEPALPAARRPSWERRPAPPPPNLPAIVATTRLPLYGVPAGIPDLALAGFQSQHLPDHAEVTLLSFSNHRTVATDRCEDRGGARCRSHPPDG